MRKGIMLKRLDILWHFLVESRVNRDRLRDSKRDGLEPPQLIIDQHLFGLVWVSLGQVEGRGKGQVKRR